MRGSKAAATPLIPGEAESPPSTFFFHARSPTRTRSLNVFHGRGGSALGPTSDAGARKSVQQSKEALVNRLPRRGPVDVEADAAREIVVNLQLAEQPAHGLP
mmetsp:Transcript_22061/g.74778  ORF Transcript_22061/g.74778 Transcript_22061/m.74778 type:complete len:102 (-) Transcript_22061:1112-1417(-)